MKYHSHIHHIKSHWNEEQFVHSNHHYHNHVYYILKSYFVFYAHPLHPHIIHCSLCVAIVSRYPSWTVGSLPWSSSLCFFVSFFNTRQTKGKKKQLYYKLYSNNNLLFCNAAGQQTQSAAKRNHSTGLFFYYSSLFYYFFFFFFYNSLSEALCLKRHSNCISQKRWLFLN